MIFLLVLISVAYCIVGAVAGFVCFMNGKWPVGTESDSCTTTIRWGKTTYSCTTTIKWGKTVLFLILCGPLFWIFMAFISIFTAIIGLLE